MKDFLSKKEERDFITACENGDLCDESYCPYMEGVSGRLGACEGDFCEMAWDNYCELNEKDYENKGEDESMDIVDEIGMVSMLGQLAEECAELGKAALKYQRILIGKNPTPVTPEEALANILEEATDVTDCLVLLRDKGIAVDDPMQSEDKRERWEHRILEKKNEQN